MTLTLSTMLPLQSQAPDFKLLNVNTNELAELNSLKSPIATVIMFICNHCPYVKHIQQKLVEVAEAYQAKGMHFIAISSNNIATHPDDAPDKMREQHYPFPYLYDETQDVARAYQAACTPDFYCFDAHLRCVYRGRFDEATPGNNQPVTGKDLTDALDAVLAGQPIATDQHPSIGCNIKWKH